MAWDPVTFAERLDWQRRCVRVLCGLLERAEQEGLALLGWTICRDSAVLIGHLLGSDPTEARRQFEAWATALGATPSPERTSGSRVHLLAIAEGIDGMVSVSVAADIDQPGGRG